LNYLITGITGFVGRSLKERLLEAGHTVYGLSRNPLPASEIGKASRFFHFPCDLTNPENLKSCLNGIILDGVFHLAAQSSVKMSWEKPTQTYQANVQGTASLIEALKAQKESPRLLLISSGEVYGTLKQADVCRETNPLNPQSPYALSKYFSEEIAQKFYAEKAIIVRPFSHLGPGQSEQFAIPNFCKQISEMRKGLKDPVLSVGNIQGTRSITALTDVLDAYRILMDKALTGEVYNVASALRTTLQEVLSLLKELSGVDFEIHVDASRLRPVDNLETPLVNCQKIKTLGWTAKMGLRDILREVWQQYA
jgi:GDP-4-dehydro-6-deoxy-D-mannose reductase